MNGIRAHDLCDNGVVLNQLSYQASWEKELVSRKTRKPFGSVKLLLVHLYLKTEKCILLKLPV